MIPITFNKDDLNNVKKGNVRGQDLASFLSISMPKRAGVLDIFDDPCGYVQITPTTGYAIVTMKKGYINIYGRCIYVEQNEQVQIALPTSGTVTGTFGIRINLGETGANEVAWFTKTTTLQQDNILNNEITGIYEFALYNYTATSSGLTLTKIATVIQNIDDYLKGANFTTPATSDNSTKLATTEFVDNKITSRLGFEKHTYSNTATASNGRTNQHYYTVLDFLGVRMIYGTINALEANTNTAVNWETTLLNSASLDKAVFIPSFTTQTRSDDRGMDEPCHIKGVSTSGFTIYNSNGYTVTGTYLVIGEPA